MEKLTYAMYLANPAIRDAIERDVRHARAQAVDRYLVTPVTDLFTKMLARAQAAVARSARVPA